MGGDPWEPKGAHGRGTLASPKDPMGGDPRQPKGSHGKGPLGPPGIQWEGTLGREGTLGSPETTEDKFGASWSLQEAFWRYSVLE